MSCIVLKCYQCGTFQVHQQKKSKKWTCKMCNEKQSFVKIYTEGSGAECRGIVQNLNMGRMQMTETGISLQDNPSCLDSTPQAQGAFLAETTPSQHRGCGPLQCQSVEQTGSKWSSYLDSDPVGADAAHDSESEDDWDNPNYGFATATQGRQGKEFQSRHTKKKLQGEERPRSDSKRFFRGNRRGPVSERKQFSGKESRHHADTDTFPQRDWKEETLRQSFNSADPGTCPQRYGKEESHRQSFKSVQNLQAPWNNTAPRKFNTFHTPNSSASGFDFGVKVVERFSPISSCERESTVSKNIATGVNRKLMTLNSPKASASGFDSGIALNEVENFSLKSSYGGYNIQNSLNNEGRGLGNIGSVKDVQTSQNTSTEIHSTSRKDSKWSLFMEAEEESEESEGDFEEQGTF